MASIKISNLPDLTSDRVTNNDYFIVNDENQTTTKLRFVDLVEAVGGQNIVFTGVVRFTGSVSIDVVDDTDSNVYTKTSVNTLIAESEARSAALVQENTDDITRLVALTKAPSTGGIYLGGTFSGAASAATNLVDALNAVANESASSSASLAGYAPLAGATFTGDVDVQGVLAVGGSAVVTVAELADNNTNVVLKGTREIGDASEYSGNADSFFTKKEANDRFLQISVNDVAALLGVGQYEDNATAAADIGVGAIYLQVVGGVAQGLKITA